MESNVSQKQKNQDTGVIYSCPLSLLEGNIVVPLTKILNSIRNYTYVNCKHNIHIRMHINVLEFLNIFNILTNISCHRNAVFYVKAFPITFQKAIHHQNNREK